MAEQTALGHPFSTVTSDDHGGLIYIAVFLALTYSNITFFTRCYIKMNIFGFDDYAMLAAQVANMAQFAFVMVSLSSGLGRNFSLLSESQYSKMASAQYGNQILLYFSLGLSKCAAVLLVQRLCTRDTQRNFWIGCNIVTASMVTWTILAVLVISAGCAPESIAPARESQICPSISSRYQVVVITDVLTDVVLVLVPTYLVWRLRMSVLLKAQVIAVFAVRLPLIPVSILALLRFNRSLYHSNPGVARSSAIILQQAQLCYSLIAGTIPCLKSFIRSFDTGSGVKAAVISNAYGSSGHSNNESYRMHNLSSNGSASRSRDEDPGDLKVNNRPFPQEKGRQGRRRPKSTTSVTALSYQNPQSHKPRDEDDGSQELFIRRDVQWEVHSENIPCTA
ncbi:hypothetical protein B0J11DRAFT_274837 [Dendryphion nanum]|uniref:Rhodopsin domain-containing protein n=1 Tax=Dendryphion nanum TaxID=256645 RepID=A0A9P9IRJ6_9PLEO|nr:hypothetical protein B0J11DRAFT_274837 [Dendryphion nanum]